MQISSNSSYNIGSSYSIQLNQKEILVVDEDPNSKLQFEARQEKNDKEQELKKTEKKNKASNPQELDPEQKEQVKELAARDAEVKAHEAAHQAAAGGLAGAASYTYQQGPDGKMYAIGGEVPISAPASSSPEEALQNARKILAAATAPGDPSGQDMAVASSAAMMQVKAQQQLAQKAQEEAEGTEIYKNLRTLSLNESQEKEKSFDISA